MQQLLYLLLTHQDYIFLAMFVTLAVVAFVNFVHNPYAKQNAKLKKFNRKIVKTPSSVIVATKHLPTEYQRQWRAFVNSGCHKPSTVFEFVKLPNRYLLWFVHFWGVVISLVYIVISFALSLPHILATQIAFLFGSALVLLINSLIGQINLSHARRVFGRFLHDLNMVTAIVKCNKVSTVSSAEPSTCSGDMSNIQQSQSLSGPLQQRPVDTSVTLQQPTSSAPLQNQTQQGQDEPKQPHALSTAQTHQPTDAPLQSTVLQTDAQQPAQTSTANGSLSVVDKAVSALRQKGLTNPRTIEEQRKLNIALNNLLQACCKYNS